jgi:hypothetical protein
MNNQNIEILLKNKIKDLGEFLLSICNDIDKKKDINDALIDLPTYKILLFISFLDHNKIDDQIIDFIKLFQLNDNNENRNEIKKYIDYFLQIKAILNE